MNVAAKKADFRQSTAAMFLTLKDEDVAAIEEGREDVGRQGERIITAPISEVFDFVNNPYMRRYDDPANPFASKGQIEQAQHGGNKYLPLTHVIMNDNMVILKAGASVWTRRNCCKSGRTS